MKRQYESTLLRGNRMNWSRYSTTCGQHARNIQFIVEKSCQIELILVEIDDKNIPRQTTSCGKFHFQCKSHLILMINFDELIGLSQPQRRRGTIFLLLLLLLIILKSHEMHLKLNTLTIEDVNTNWHWIGIWWCTRVHSRITLDGFLYEQTARCESALFGNQRDSTARRIKIYHLNPKINKNQYYENCHSIHSICLF